MKDCSFTDEDAPRFRLPHPSHPESDVPRLYRLRPCSGSVTQEGPVHGGTRTGHPAPVGLPPRSSLGHRDHRCDWVGEVGEDRYVTHTRRPWSHESWTLRWWAPTDPRSVPTSSWGCSGLERSDTDHVSPESPGVLLRSGAPECSTVPSPAEDVPTQGRADRAVLPPLRPTPPTPLRHHHRPSPGVFTPSRIPFPNRSGEVQSLTRPRPETRVVSPTGGVSPPPRPKGPLHPTHTGSKLCPTRPSLRVRRG